MTAADGDRSPSQAEAIASAVLAVPDVAAMSAGPLGQFRSYLPGGRSVPGVRIDDDALEVNVVCRYVPGLDRVGAQVQRALADLADGRAITVSIDDVVAPGESAPVVPLVEDEPPLATAQDEHAVTTSPLDERPRTTPARDES